MKKLLIILFLVFNYSVSWSYQCAGNIKDDLGMSVIEQKKIEFFLKKSKALINQGYLQKGIEYYEKALLEGYKIKEIIIHILKIHKNELSIEEKNVLNESITSLEEMEETYKLLLETASYL